MQVKDSDQKSIQWVHSILGKVALGANVDMQVSLNIFVLKCLKDLS